MKRITSLALGTLALLFCLQAQPVAAANSFTIGATWKDSVLSDGTTVTNMATGTVAASIPFANVDITTFNASTEVGITLASTSSSADFFGGGLFHSLGDDPTYTAGKTNVSFTDSDPAGTLGTLITTLSWTTNQLTIHCSASFDVFGLQYAVGYEVFDTNFADTSHAITDVFDYNDVEFPLGTQIFSQPIYVTGTNTAGATIENYTGFPLNNGSMSGAADYIPPTVTITAPLNNTTVTTNVVTFSGTAADNIALGYLDQNTGQSNFVLYVLNGVLPPAEVATFDGTNWTQQVTLNPGPNTFVVQSIDQSGNVSAFATDVVTFIVASPLTLAANPPTWGTVTTSASNTNAVQIGTTNTATATAKPGFDFVNWTAADINGTVILANPTQNPLTFDMSTNLALTANFADIQPPTVKITSPTINAVSNSSLTFAGTAMDNVAVASVTYILNGQPSLPVGTYDGSNTWSTMVNLNGGTNVFVVTATDTSGNSTSVTDIVNFIVVSQLQLAVNPSGYGTISGSVTSGELLVVSSNYSVTATANPGFGFVNWTATDTNGTVILPNPTQNPLTFTMFTNLTLTANFKDTQPPTVKITFPANNASISSNNNAVTFSGTAVDNVGVVSVQYSFNGPLTPVNSFLGTSWSTTVNLNGGLNTFIVTATDAAGNTSSATDTVTYVITSGLTLQALPSSGGTVTTSASNPQTVQIGSVNTATATATSGFTFNGWTATDINGPVVLTNAAQNPLINPLTFNMRTNLTLVANFVTNSVFTNSKGSYSGLFYATNTDTNGFATNSGYLSLSVLTSGRYSGVITMLSGRYPFTGQLSYNANTPGTPYTANVSVNRGKLPALDVDLSISALGFLVADPTTTNTQGMVGSAPLSYGAQASALVGTNTNALAGTYNVVIPGQATAGVITNGNSYGTVTVSKNGMAVLSLNLADASVGSSGGTGGAATAPAGSFLFFLQQAGAAPTGAVGVSSGPLDANNSFPFFIPLYNAKGLIMGVVTVAANSGNPTDVASANVDWVKEANASATYYSNGFSLTLTNSLQGSFFNKNNYATNINYNGALLTLSGGNLPAADVVTVNFTNNVPSFSGNTNKFTLSSFTLATGLITGTFQPNPASSAAVPFKALYIPGSVGAYLPASHAAFGFFISTNQTGSVELDIP